MGRRRRLLGFLLVGLVLIAFTKAQSNPAAVSQSPTFSQIPSATPSNAKAPSIRPSTTENSHLVSDFQEYSAEDLLVPFQEECVAHVVQIIRGDGPKTKLKCTLANGLSYLIPSVDEQWINEHMVLGELISSETTMTLPADAMLNQRTHEIHMTDPPRLWNYEMEERELRRKLRRLATTGTKTVLVVRVQATDVTTTPTVTQLANHVFGDDGNDFNLKYQYEACSANQLTLNKASDRTGASTSISNGIVTISVTAATNAGAVNMENSITSALNSEFGVNSPADLANHLMYCFPPGTTTSLAYAQVNGYLSYFNDVACTYPSAQIHELGHNFNMGHSSDSANEYGDQSGLMGFSYEETERPKMCFNAAKSWQLGWYTSKADSVSPSSSNPTFSRTLAGIVDYSSTANKVLIEIQQSSSTTYYYVNYNRKAGFNIGTIEGGDLVQVVSKDTSVDTNVSMALAVISVGDAYTISDFNGKTGETLTISFTALTNNEADVEIALTGFPVGATPSPTGAPSRTPSKAPSKNPSVVPSSKPSLNPSLSPSKMPSGAPSLLPSKVPSGVPSLLPSQTPSKTPSKMPSGVPSLVPSLAPSEIPSQSAAPSMSAGPSSTPSSTSNPSSSTEPSSVPSTVPSISNAPSTPAPSQSPSILPSNLPSLFPSRSLAPSMSSQVPTATPTTSSEPSMVPTSSSRPSTSAQPTREPLRPIVEWKMLLANRFGRAFSDVVETGANTDTDSDTIVITATNTTNYRVGEEKPVLAMTGQAIIELNEWVDVSSYDRIQMLFWFYARRNQANLESDRFVVEYALDDDNTTWFRLKSFQRGRGRFRRNNQWYLGRILLFDTGQLQKVRFRVQTFFPTSTKMILLDKFGILGFAQTLGGTEAGGPQTYQESRGGGPNRKSYLIRGKSTTMDEDWLSRQPLV